MVQNPTHEEVSFAAVDEYCNGQDDLPLSSGRAAHVALRALETGASLQQLEAVSVSGDGGLWGYAVERAFAAHRRMGITIPEEHVVDEMPKAAGIGLNVAAMAIYGAAGGYKFNKITAERPDAYITNRVELVLKSQIGRNRVKYLLRIATSAIGIEDQGLPPLDAEYRQVLTSNATSGRFPRNTYPNADNRHIQRNALMVVVERRLRAAFAEAREGGSAVEALIHNLTVGPPDSTVRR